MYPDYLLALRLVTHLHENIPIPTPRSVLERDNDSSSAGSIYFFHTSKSSASIASILSDEERHSSQAADVPQLLNQNDLNDLVRDLCLTKEKSKLFCSRLNNGICCRKESTAFIFVPDSQVFKIFFLSRIMCVIAATLSVFFEALNSEHHSNK